jgi:ABC-2 type transport system permease protein
MKQAIAIAMLQIKLMLKKPGTLVMMFVMPLSLIAAFALFAGGHSGTARSPLLLVDEDKSFVAGKLIAELQQDASLKIQMGAADAIPTLLASHEISGGVLIPKGFQKAIESAVQPELQVITAPGSSLQLTVGPSITYAATVTAENYTMARRLSGGSDAPEKLRAAYDNVVAERQRLRISVVQPDHPSTEHAQAQLRERALGFTVMFVMMTVLMMSGVILQERQAGTWGRILMTPTPQVAVVSGYLLSFWLMGALQFGVLVGASRLLFNVKWGPLLPLSAVGLAVVCCATGMGLFLVGIMRTAEQQRIFGLSFVVVTSMLGGVYWPLDVMGDTMRMIGHLTPQAWAMDALRVVMLRGGSWAALLVPLAVLMAMGTLLTGASLLRMRSE